MKRILLGAVALGALALPFASHAASIGIERYTYTYVTPTGADFAGSVFGYTNTINYDQDPVTNIYNVTAQPVATGIVFYGQGATTVSPTAAPDHTPLTDITVTSPGGPGQGWGFDYNGTASATPGQSFLITGLVAGHYALTFSGGGSGFVDNGGRFVSTVVLNGDWSGLGSHTAASFGAGYTLTQDFVYDPVADTTVVAVETADYEGINPSLGFSLLGAPAPIPEPASLALLGLGVAGLAALRRRG